MFVLCASLNVQTLLQLNSASLLLSDLPAHKATCGSPQGRSLFDLYIQHAQRI